MGERGSGTSADDSSLSVAKGGGMKAEDDAAAILARIRRRSPKADPQSLLPDVHPARLPRHIAIIMDGNGRWARSRGMPRSAGHAAGAESVRRVIETAGKLGIEVITLYSFSMENWKRSSEEIDALMALCLKYLASECEGLVREGVRLRVLGRRDGLPRDVLAALDHVVAATRGGTTATLCLALNYGGRAEIVDAVQAIARKVRDGTLDAAAIDDQVVSNHLYTAGLPDPDLVIRTAGEMRISNYLLWQISYAELWVTEVLWPEFGGPELCSAIRDYAARTRRFGAAVEK